MHPRALRRVHRDLRERVPNSDKAIWSVHCHNDLGMAVANSLAGVKIGGARQVECTINGLGERAGNCSLEEVVMAVKTRRDYFGLDVGIDASQIVPASRMVSQTTGFVVQPNKAVVGANAFAHASGIHQDGVLKARDTYEIMRAEDVGWAPTRSCWASSAAAMPSSSACRTTGHRAGFSEADINEAFARFKDLADRKSEIFDEDIIALVSPEGCPTPAERPPPSCGGGLGQARTEDSGCPTPADAPAAHPVALWSLSRPTSGLSPKCLC
jgi:2-isopropylmalate synthase